MTKNTLNEKKLLNDLRNVFDVILSVYEVQEYTTPRMIAEQSGLSYSTILKLNKQNFSLSTHIGTLMKLAQGCGLAIYVGEENVVLRVAPKKRSA